MITQKTPSSSYRPSYDRTPKYTVKQVAEMMEMSAYTIRYYENAGLIPDVDRSGGNARMFSDYTLGWLRLVHCLRMTGPPRLKASSTTSTCARRGTPPFRNAPN